jgi:hypothetical protein
MDMQPKVIFTIHRTHAQPIIREAILDTSKVIDSGIEVSEYAHVQVRVEAAFDPHTTLKIESFEKENILEIKEFDQDVTIMAGQNTEHMLVPGHYPFEVLYQGKKFYSYYTVLSKDFSSESLLNLRQYLEMILKGLSYDLMKQRLGMATPVSNINPSLLQLFQFIYKNKNHIQRNLEMIMKDPVTDLVGEYQLRTSSQKPDRKSLRWQAQKGKNTLISNPRVYYEKHAQLSLINIENQWVRFIINYFLQSLRKLELSFQKEITLIHRKQNHQSNLLILNQRQLAELGSNTFGYQKSMDDLKRNRTRITGRINELEKEKENYQNHKQFIRQITYLFTDFGNLSGLQSISQHKPRKVTQRLLKDHRYRRLYNLYKELSRLETKHVDSQIPGIQFRRTWQLFEYYNVGLMIDILRDNGYRWVEGWLASKDNPHQHIGTLPEDTILRFEKTDSDHYIELAYDTELEHGIKDQTYSRYFNGNGRRPDIRLTIYRKDGSLYSHKAGLILEVKCRRHRYLINEEIEPDIKAQLKEFMNLEYYDSQERDGYSVKNPIKQVIVLYPKQSGMEPIKNDHVYGERLIYIQIEPNDPSSESKPFGYESLKSKIDDFLSQVKEREGIYA